uniref:Uncharacterized protein n=1 Tax=viral metagenome TaxID=1070528 RepID=A0A6M3J0J0_9ZZZZ
MESNLRQWVKFAEQILETQINTATNIAFGAAIMLLTQEQLEEIFQTTTECISVMENLENENPDIRDQSS